MHKIHLTLLTTGFAVEEELTTGHQSQYQARRNLKDRLISVQTARQIIEDILKDYKGWCISHGFQPWDSKHMSPVTTKATAITIESRTLFHEEEAD